MFLNIDSSKCTALRESFPHEYQNNKISTGFATTITIVISIVYLINIFHIIRGITAAQGGRRSYKHERAELDIDKLLSLSVSAFAVVILRATWTQTIEATAILINVIAQIGALALQNNDLDQSGKSFIEMLWNIIVVCMVASAFSLSDVRARWLEINSSSGVYRDDDPQRQVILAYVFAGLTLFVAFPQEILVRKTQSVKFKKTIRKLILILIYFTYAVDTIPQLHNQFPFHIENFLTCCAVKCGSILFVVVQLAVATASIYYGQLSLLDGCIVFNLAKFSSLATLGIGILYSVTLLVMRCKLVPITWKEEEEQEQEEVKEDNAEKQPEDEDAGASV